MRQNVFNNKANLLFIVLAGFFIANTLIAEFIGVKIFSLEKTLGFEPLNLSLFGIENLSFQLTAGVLLWPVVFVMTDIINDYYGKRGVQFLSILTAILIGYAFVMLGFSIKTVPADWWTTSHIDPSLTAAQKQSLLNEVGNYNSAYKVVLGQGQSIIVASLIAFLIGQLLDAYIFNQIKKKTGNSKVWLRATLSTFVSQFVDSFVVLFVAFKLAGNWSWAQLFAVGTMNYLYKFLTAILLIPLVEGVHKLIEWYLGKQLSEEMRSQAIEESL